MRITRFGFMFAAVAVLSFLSCLDASGSSGGDSGGGPGDGSHDDPGSGFDPETQALHFPAAVGSAWRYDLEVYDSDETVGTNTRHIRVSLDAFDGATHVYSLSALEHVKRVTYYGAPGGMSDLIEYFDSAWTFLLRNRGDALEGSLDGGSTWRVLYATDASRSFSFHSLFVASQGIAVSCGTCTDYVDSLPMDPLGRFEGYEAEGYVSTGGGNWKRNREFYDPSFGLIEAYSEGHAYSAGYLTYVPPDTDRRVEHLMLRGYRVGTEEEGEDVDETVYTTQYRY